MADEWYYAKGKEKVGPLTAAQMKQLARSGELARTSMVWKTGMPKWVQAGQVNGLFPEAPPQKASVTVPPPLPVEQTNEPAAVRSPGELKFPVIGMFVVSGLALLFGLIGVVAADSPVVRVLQALGIAHNLAALALTVNVVRLRSYALASVSPWVVMTCWLWHWMSNVTHGVPLLGMVLAVSAGVWALLVLRGADVRRAFDADPPLPPLFGGRQAPAYTPEPGTRFPWPVEERTASNPKLMWLKVAIAASIVVGVLLLVTIVGAIFCLPFFSLAFLIHFFGVSRGRLHGRWVPVEGASGWVEFLPGGILKREDGTVGTFALLPNQKFIDLLAYGHLVDSWKILSWGSATLEVQDMEGRARGFKKGKTLEEQPTSSLGEQQPGNKSVAETGGMMDARRFAEAMTHVDKANKHRRVGEWDQAIQECAVAINLFPRNFLAYAERGMALNGKGNETGDSRLFTSAVGDFTTAIEIGSDDPGTLGETHYNRGCILTDDLGSHADAIADFRRTLELLPGHHGALQGMQRATRAMQS